MSANKDEIVKRSNNGFYSYSPEGIQKTLENKIKQTYTEFEYNSLAIYQRRI